MQSKVVAKVAPMIKAVCFSLLTLAISSCGGADGKALVIEILLSNLATETSFVPSDGIPAVVAFSPAFGVVHEDGTSPLFTSGSAASSGLESLAEDGNFVPLIDELSLTEGVRLTAAVNTPEGEESPGPLLPGGTYRLLITVQQAATGGGQNARVSLASMFLQSNDVFVASPEGGLRLFDDAGNVITGDRSGELLLLDAGTEVNQEPGLGADQALRQMDFNQGAAEGGIVRGVDDGFVYPSVPSVLRMTVNVVGEFAE